MLIAVEGCLGVGKSTVAKGISCIQKKCRCSSTIFQNPGYTDLRSTPSAGKLTLMIVRPRREDKVERSCRLPAPLS
jgi:thymidylate kinase